MKLATIFCKPRPMPTPAAPVKTASAERLMPTALSAIVIATTSNPMRIILTSSTWIEGVKSVERLIRLSAKLLAILVSHSARMVSAPALIRSSGVSRKPPSTTATESESRNSTAVSSWPMMLSAATSHADSDTTFTIKALRITDVIRRIASQASASLAVIASR